MAALQHLAGDEGLFSFGHVTTQVKSMLPQPPSEPFSTEASDRSLLRRVRLGSEDAATELYLRYARRLHELSRNNSSRDVSARVDPEDIVQSVFRTFFRRVAKGEYDIPDGEELWKLFLVIGLNKIRAVGVFHRAAKRNVRATAGGEALEQTGEPTTQGDETSLNILRLVIDEILDELPPVHREMIQLRIEGHDVATIAERLGRSKRSVERNLQGFREMLAKRIQDEE